MTSLYCQRFDAPDIKKYLMTAYGHSKFLNLKRLVNSQYSLLKCNVCNLVFQENVPTEEMMSELYERWIDPVQAFRRQSQYGISYFSRYSQDIHHILVYMKKKPSTVKVLDFGMGWGCWALMAKAFGCEVYGVELSEKRIEQAQRNGIQVIAWDDIPSYQFDIINADQVFEHLVNPIEVLTHLKQSLSSDGVIKVCVPNAFGIGYRLKKMDWDAPKGSLKSLNPVAPLEHINCFYRKSMLALATGVGLSEVKIPMKIQYQHPLPWRGFKSVLKNLFMPLYRNILGLQNYYLFKK